MHLKSAELGINSTALKAFSELKKMIYWCSHFVDFVSNSILTTIQNTVMI